MKKIYTQNFQETIHFEEKELIIECSELVKGSLILSLDGNVELIHFLIKDGAQINCFLQNKMNQKLELQLEADVERDADFTLGFLDIQDGECILSQKVNLNGPGANFEWMSAQLCSGSVKKDTDIQIQHLASHTTGIMKNYAVLLDNADYQMVANGDIHKGCSESQSHQTTRVLTLGKGHKAKVIPLMLIDENEVKASHAMSIGQPDEEQLYYLQSRGLSYKQALGLLSVGYLLPVLDLVQEESLKEELHQQMESKVGLYGSI